MSCEQFREDLVAYVGGEVEGERRAAIEQHLAECEPCRQEAQALQQVLAGARLADDDETVRQVQNLIGAALEQGASDIHLLPQPDGVHVRYRVDGALRTHTVLARALHAALVVRLKVMADVDAAATGVPQDGRMHLVGRGREVDVRANFLPTILGEKVTMRLLSRDTVQLGLPRLGLSPPHLQQAEQFLRLPAGLLVATGPIGCGKTTLLYSMLTALDADRLSICTVEDPVELALARTQQTQVNVQAGLTFAAALRSIMRCDPDVVMAGEIRDLASMELVVQATLTGHLCLTALHAPSAAAALCRMRDMGVEPWLIADALRLVVAQRLVRKVCPECREEAELRPEQLPTEAPPLAALVGQRVAHARGCTACAQTGYQGRVGLFEVLTVDGPVRTLVARGLCLEELKRALAASGHRTLADDGVAKVLAGLTTPDEVWAAVQDAV